MNKPEDIQRDVAEDERSGIAAEVGRVESKGLRNEIAVIDSERGRQLAPANASQAMTFAQMMARSGAAVPSLFRNNAGLCLGVTLDAMTFGFNPFALSRCAYEVGGAIGYESKIFVAALNRSGFLRERLKFTYTGEIKGTHDITTKSGTKQAPAGNLVCIVSGRVIDSDEVLEWPSPELGKITTKNSPLWFSDPKLQLFYYTARAWSRVHCPEVMLGVQTKDELEDNIDLREEVRSAPRQTLMDRVKAHQDQKAAAEPDDSAKIEGALDVEVEPVSETEAPDPEKAPAQKARKPRKPNEQKPEPVEASPAEDATPPAEPAAADQEQTPAAEEVTDPSEIETFEQAIARLQTIADAAPHTTALDSAHKAWLESITDFSKTEQFDLQQEGDLIIGRRRIDIRRQEREKKA